MEPRGRGRGYGRARGQPQQQQQQQQQRPGGPGPQQQRPQQPAPRQGLPPRGPPTSAWVRPVQPATSAWPRPQMGAPKPQLGRGAIKEAEQQGAIPRTVVGQGDEGNQGPVHSTQGTSVRGRVFNKGEDRGIIFTKPSTVVTKQGTSGRPITLESNYLPLTHNGKWCLYQYRVDMAPDIDHTGKRKGLVRDATRELFTSGYLFDGTVLYTPLRIQNDNVELFAKDDEENIRITIRLVGDLAWGDPHYIQLFNIVIRKCLHLMGLTLVGRNYFMPSLAVELREHNIQLWPGYSTSIRQHETHLLLNVDLSYKFMRMDNVYDVLMECQGPNTRREFQAKIIGSVVLTAYNNKTYKIDDVDFNSGPDSTFKMKDGSEISYRQYFQRKYDSQFKHKDQPMLISRSKPREIRAGMAETVYLVPELCKLTGLTDKQRESFQLMKAVSTHTRLGTEVRIKKLLDFSQKIHSKPDVVAEIKRWDLGIAKNLIEFQGRVLPMEFLYGEGGDDKNKYPAGASADWTRDVRSKKMAHSAKMSRLAVVCPSRLRSATEEFIRTLVKTASGMYWSLGNPRIFEIGNDSSASYIEKIEDIINTAQPTLILVILTTNSADRYSAIKKKCYVDRGVPTQMFVARNLNNKGIMSIATKVAIQMNCKIGGAPWLVPIPLSSLMVVGYDVCRDTANKKKSFSGFVASLDKNCTRYFSFTSEHQMEEELSNNFATFMVMACQKYKEVNGSYPTRIVIYRDGVGEGQLKYVYEQEVANIKRRLVQEIYKDPAELRMAFIIVSKRINTRIFAARQNPPPGTVVDNVITLPERYDFYIVSQCVRQGTVSPTSYNIIEDTLGLGVDQMQILTFKLTHMYYNWSGTVRVPAPCQYAHKLAFMTSQNLHRPAHTSLSTVLYYL